MAQVSLPNQLVNGTVADASQVMANFNAIVDVINGNLGSDNIQNIAGNDVTVQDGIGGGTDTLNNFTQRMQTGTVYSPEFPKGESRETEITFPKAFPGTPYIFVQPYTSWPERRFAGYTSVDKNGFTMIFKRTEGGSGRFTVKWLAIYPGAM